jgi:diamine N-acetyltransferase
MTIRLRLTAEADIPFVYNVEHAEENSQFLLPWSEERHREALTNPDIRHLIAEKTETGQPLGYVILAGLANPHDSIELMRITLAVKGKGYGRNILRQIKHWAFTDRQANRLWLSEGFRIEGKMRECLKTGNTYESLIVQSMLAREFSRQAEGTAT